MPTKLRSQTTTEPHLESVLSLGRRLPRYGPPTPPGEMRLEEFIKPLGITQSELAVLLGISFPRLNEVIHARRAVTPDTALRLGQFFSTAPQFWLNLQQSYDLKVAEARAGTAIRKRVRPAA